MLPYYVMLAAPIAYAGFQLLLRERRFAVNKNIPILIFFTLYFLLLALRGRDVGSDLYVYLTNFKRMSWTAWGSITEIEEDVGYAALVKLVSELSGNQRQIFVAVVAAITVIPVMILYYKEAEDPLTTIALFLTFPVFIMNFSGLRQAIAIAIGVPAFYAVQKKRRLLFLLLVVAASTVHSSAVLLLLMYPVYHMNMRPKHLLVLIPAVLATYLFRSQLFSFALNVLGDDYVERYSDTAETGAYAMIFLFALFVAYAFIMPDESEMDSTTVGLRNFLVLVLFIQLFSSISTLSMRLNYYFLIFVPLLIPRLTNRSPRMSAFTRRSVKIVMVVFFFGYYLYRASFQDSLGIYPYEFFWQ